VLTEKSFNPECTYPLASTVAAQLEFLADLKTNAVVAAQGMLSRHGSGGFVSLVTDANGLLRVVST
jgi:hypothetical protein